MKRIILNLLSMLLFFAATTILSSCGDEEDNPPTNETIVGRKYYSDNKLFAGTTKWQQVEIRFASDGVAYLQLTETDYETGRIQSYNPDKATFHLNYPDIVFDYNYRGYEYSAFAHFSNYNTLVFDGEEYSTDHEHNYFPSVWSNRVQGLKLSNAPITISTPYTWQVYHGRLAQGNNNENPNGYTLYFGSSDAFASVPYSGRHYKSYTINYPDIILVYDSETIHSTFIDSNTIEFQASSFDPIVTLTRER